MHGTMLFILPMILGTSLIIQSSAIPNDKAHEGSVLMDLQRALVAESGHVQQGDSFHRGSFTLSS
jgi:hypothetical protein